MKKEKSSRFFFGLDVLSLSRELDFQMEKDQRNSRASKLIKKAALSYMIGGQIYEDMLNDVGDNLFSEYQDWYSDNIVKPVKSGPIHLSEDYDGGPIPKYDANKYSIANYFNGLNKSVFEELQKLILFLMNHDLKEALSYVQKDDGDEQFLDHTEYFFIFAHSIFIACLEGGDFLNRIEKIFDKYDVLSGEEGEKLNRMIDDNIADPSDAENYKDQIKNNYPIYNIAKDFLSHNKKQ